MSAVEDLAAAKKRRDAEARKTRPRPMAPAWRSQCLADERGRLVPNLANLMIALRSAPEIAAAFAFDEMQRAAVLRQKLPVAPNGEAVSGGALPRPLGDADVSQLQEWLQHEGLPKIGRETTHQAVDQRAQERPFHPVREYLEALVWDGRARLGSWLETYLKAEKSEYSQGIGRLFLVAMVARIFKPGCKADFMLVLEGEQGIGKSRACRALAGEWFSDALPDIHSKDSAQHLRGKWLVEVAELQPSARPTPSCSRRPEECYRQPYERKGVIEPRQCVFVGTTNRTAYLRDETVARRFWPVKDDAIDVDVLARDRDQLLAEAVTQYRKGANWWPDATFERKHIKPQEEARFEADVWEQTNGSYVAGRTKVTIAEVATSALHMDTARISTRNARRIAAVLTTLGWAPGKRTTSEHP